MWRNYLTVGMRALMKSRAYALINIFGLAVGLAACVLILLYVRYESSYDGWMKDADQAFQLQTFIAAKDRGGENINMQLSAIAAARALAKDFPQVEKTVFVRSFSPVVLQDGQPSQVDTLRMVDGNIFDILQVPFVRGDPRHVLDDTHSLTISESEAKRRFGNADPIGQTLTIVDNTGNVDYRVTGVFKDLPRNSSFSATMVARFDLDVQFADRVQALTSWSSQQGWNFVKLRPGADAAAINAQLRTWEKRNIPDEVVNGERRNAGDIQDFALVNIRDVHLGKAQGYPMTQGNDRTTVTTFAVIALLVLGMACVNFTNLATARASQRAREVALRKVLGANRKQLIVQFMSESMLLTTIAMVLALATVELFLPVFNRFLDADIPLHYFGLDGVLLPALLLILLVGTAGGLIPCTIVGVVSDARFRSLREPIQPTVYVMQKVGFEQVAVRYAGVAPSVIRERVEEVWHRVMPTVPFEAEFADDLVREQYQQDTARGQLFASFAVLAVVIGCLGLFGLAAFTAERRTKEIGIRKVLGAGTGDIVRLLVWQFSRPILIANLIAWPIAWWLMRDWLNGFDTRIPLTPVPFIAAGVLALAVALGTIASHAVRVARLNPVHALRYE